MPASEVAQPLERDERIAARGGKRESRRETQDSQRRRPPIARQTSAVGPRVAVVVPCFNSGSTLPDTLASVRGEECELVVVDDGSTDEETLDVLSRVESAGVRLLRQANAGVAAARMAGVAATSAPYVFPLDADDVLAAGALSDLADVLDADRSVHAVWGWVGSVVTDTVTRMAPTLDPWLITYMNTVPIFSLVRRDALLAAGGWRSGVLHEDWDLWLAFAERGFRGRRIPRIVAYYRPSRTGRWATSRDRYDEAVAQYRRDHAPLFAARRTNWRRSTAPLRVRLALPVIDRLPVSARMKLRLGGLVRRPYYTVRSALRARRPSSETG